jgi:hypothetical protein
MKAKTNFDYDPKEATEGTFLPLRITVPPPPPAPAAGPTTADDGSIKNLQFRRYVGIKVRKKTADKGSPSAPILPTISTNSASAAAATSSNMANIPAQLMQTRYVLSNVGRSNGHVGAGPMTTVVAVDPANVDWSKQPYTPLEISTPATYQTLHTLGEPDWRDQIYYWIGQLSYNEEEQCLVWSGRWLGSFTGRPVKEEFDSSRNEFRYLSQTVEKSKVEMEDSLKPLSGFFKGEYFIDAEGNGELEKFDEQDVLLEFEEFGNKSPPIYNVYGKGDSEFGVFILHGNYNSGNKQLEMTRQYLPENDIRSSMSLIQLKHYFKRMAGQSR